MEKVSANKIHGGNQIVGYLVVDKASHKYYVASENVYYNGICNAVNVYEVDPESIIKNKDIHAAKR